MVPRDLRPDREVRVATTARRFTMEPPSGTASKQEIRMSSPGSVTHWLFALKDGDATAAQPIWERYHARLVGLARQKLHAVPRRAADEDDVVQNAFHSFFRGVALGRFPQLNDRDNLWRLLVVITARKAIDHIDHSKRRTGGTHCATVRISSEEEAEALQQVIGEEPTPEFAVQVAEEYQRLLDLLDDDGLRQVAVFRMEGHTSDEIAAKLDCSRRTVARKVETIRLIWQTERLT